MPKLKRAWLKLENWVICNWQILAIIAYVLFFFVWPFFYEGYNDPGDVRGYYPPTD